MYMMVAATLFKTTIKFYRLEYVKKYYDAISKHRLNIPTPIMGGVRTPIRQFAVVFWLILMTPDSIFSSDKGIGKYVAQRAVLINAVVSGASTKSGVEKFKHTSCPLP